MKIYAQEELVLLEEIDKAVDGNLEVMMGSEDEEKRKMAIKFLDYLQQHGFFIQWRKMAIINGQFDTAT
jgi:hypothetical protein